MYGTCIHTGTTCLLRLAPFRCLKGLRSPLHADSALGSPAVFPQQKHAALETALASFPKGDASEDLT